MNSCLSYAIEREYMDIIKKSIELGANDFNRAIASAARYNHMHIVLLLLSYPDHDRDLNYAIKLAAIGNHDEMFMYLVNKCESDNKELKMEEIIEGIVIGSYEKGYDLFINTNRELFLKYIIEKSSLKLFKKYINQMPEIETQIDYQKILNKLINNYAYHMTPKITKYFKFFEYIYDKCHYPHGPYDYYDNYTRRYYPYFISYRISNIIISKQKSMAELENVCKRYNLNCDVENIIRLFI
jgi:hypothetical protein